uniref:T9SS type A sorting domain-containing protein n=1 Tax=Ignavibacterium album TaxID=591197 RepID=A0A832G8A8_9BACT
MKKLLIFIIFSTILIAQQNPNYDWILAPFENPQHFNEGDLENEAFYNSKQVTEINNSKITEKINTENYISYKWVHPKPFGTSMGVVKVWNNNTAYFFGSAGTFIKTTDGGQTFQFNNFAGVPNPLPSNLTNDIYGAHFFDMNNFYLCGVWGITKTTNGGQTFQEVGAGNFSSATLRAIQFLDANNGYVVGTSAAKMSKTTDGGLTWTVDQTLPSTTFYDIKAFTTQRIVLASATSSGGNIRTTTNGGSNWNVAAAGNGTIFSLAFFDSLIGFAGSSSGRGFKTTDGGLTWSQLTSMNAPTTATFYDIFIKGTEVYFVEDDSLLYVTADSGQTFSKRRYLGLGQSTQIMRAGDFSDSTIFVVGDNGYLFKSTNNGQSWTSQSNIVVSGILRGVWGNQTGKLIVVGSNSPNQVMVSENFGETFTPVALSVAAADIRGFYMLNSSKGFAVGNTGRIWKTTDGGYTWDLFVASTAAFSDVTFLNNQFGVASGNNGIIFKTTDGGDSWINISNTGSTAGFNGVAIVDTNTILVAGSNVVYKTTNGGTNWFQVNPGVSASPISRIRMLDANKGYIIGASGTSGVGYVFRTTDGGNNWTNINFPYSNNMLYDVAFRTEFDFVLVGAEGGVFHTTDNGLSWKQYNLGLLMTGTSQVLGVSFLGQDTLIVGGAGASLLKVSLNPIIPVELSSFSALVSGNNVKLNWTTATELNNQGFEIERKSSDSEQWIKLGFIQGSGTSTEPKSYFYEDLNLKSGSYNYRLRQIDYDGTINVYNLSETINIGVIDRFELLQNFPNPFNPSTKISWQSPVGSRQVLKVYDILGNEVATLVDEYREAGRYEVEFNASDLSSGIYFYKLTMGSFSETKKMTLIK